jgi:hypothetical protein
MTDSYDIRIRSGNSGTIANELGFVCQVLVAGAPLDMTGNEVVFRVYSAAGEEVIRKDTGDDVTVDLATATIIVPITVAESRTLAAAALRLKYDIERRNGTLQRTIICGNVLVTPGVNDD